MFTLHVAHIDCDNAESHEVANFTVLSKAEQAQAHLENKFPNKSFFISHSISLPINPATSLLDKISEEWVNNDVDVLIP